MAYNYSRPLQLSPRRAPPYGRDNPLQGRSPRPRGSCWEQEFLDYWSTQATIADRSGLVSEFLSRVEDQKQFPWMVWNLDRRWTTFVNVGIWRESADFQQQIGRFIDNKKPPLAFEAQRRRRVFLEPVRWRVGGSPHFASYSTPVK